MKGCVERCDDGLLQTKGRQEASEELWWGCDYDDDMRWVIHSARAYALLDAAMPPPPPLPLRAKSWQVQHWPRQQWGCSTWSSYAGRGEKKGCGRVCCVCVTTRQSMSGSERGMHALHCEVNCWQYHMVDATPCCAKAVP